MRTGCPVTFGISRSFAIFRENNNVTGYRCKWQRPTNRCEHDEILRLFSYSASFSEVR